MAKIANVTMEVLGTYSVRYESGASRSYAEDKLPKTVREWLGSHQEAREEIRAGQTWWKETNSFLALCRAIRGKGRGAGRAYEARIRKEDKASVLCLAHAAGMVARSRETKKQALAYLLDDTSKAA